MYGHLIDPPPGVSASSATLGGETLPLPDLVLSPSSSVISFGDLKIYRIGEGGTFLCLHLCH
jgi:polyribonucleotide 5'-hydroxyl-kinase